MGIVQASDTQGKNLNPTCVTTWTSMPITYKFSYFPPLHEITSFFPNIVFLRVEFGGSWR